MKKKILSTVFVLSVCIMTACGNTKTETNTTSNTTVAETVVESEEETTPKTDADVEETVAEPEEAKETEPEETPEVKEPEETKDSKDDKKTPDKKDDKKQEETKPAETKTNDKKDTGKNNGGNGSGSGTTPANPGTTPKPTPVNPTPSPKPTPTPTPAVCSHTWDAGTVTVKATCSKEGTKTYTCTKCNETKTESIAKTEHEYELQLTDNLCRPATCTENGGYEKVCKICGSRSGQYVSTPMIPHNRDDVRRYEATCGQNGKVEYYCTMCHGKQGEEILPATGQHTWVTVVLQDWTWNDDNDRYERILSERCGICGQGATGHQCGDWWYEYKTQ